MVWTLNTLNSNRILKQNDWKLQNISWIQCGLHYTWMLQDQWLFQGNKQTSFVENHQICTYRILLTTYGRNHCKQPRNWKENYTCCCWHCMYSNSRLIFSWTILGAPQSQQAHNLMETVPVLGYTVCIQSLEWEIWEYPSTVSWTYRREYVWHLHFIPVCLSSCILLSTWCSSFVLLSILPPSRR